MDLDPGRVLKSEKVEGLREMVVEKMSGEDMNKEREKSVVDQVRVRWAGELHS